MKFRHWVSVLALFALALVPVSLLAQGLVGEGPALGPIGKRVTQDEVERMSVPEARAAGLKIFTTPFNKFDGMGDGPMDPSDPTGLGGRPTLQNNGTLLRVNGLDTQTCLECHGKLSTALVPAIFGIGGAGSTATVAMFMPTNIDVDDSEQNGFAGYDGRLIVPPHMFGLGGVQLLGREMTVELQELRAYAIANPGEVVSLDTKGVNFGTIVADFSGEVDTREVEGIDEDLVVRPFGRKGEFPTVRQFDQGAMMFHIGMQPVEIVGPDVDADGDGVANELLIGELSALEIFLATGDRPVQDPITGDAAEGRELFAEIGCADCHRPMMTTDSRILTFSFPEVDTDPTANVFYEVNLARRPPRFTRIPGGGLEVPLFSDLKRHNMGPELAETFQGATLDQNNEFITAKLWGVADTAPYLHDGRAQTIMQAIVLHGGEAEGVRNNFLALADDDKNAILKYLRKLRNPVKPNKDVFPKAIKRPTEPLDD